MLKKLWVVLILSQIFSHTLYAAIVKLENVISHSTQDGTVIDLQFDKQVSSRLLRPTYERNFIQFAIPESVVRSARLLSVKNSEIQKIFAYQYEPGVTRVRLILKSHSNNVKGLVRIWNANSKTVRLLFPNAKYSIIENKKNDADDADLLKNVITQTTAPLAQPTEKNDETKHDIQTVSSPVKIVENKAPATVGTKAEPSRYFLRMVISLLSILGVFIGLALLVKKYATRMNLSKILFNKGERLIQVIATHRIGKTQSICLIKVTGEFMVIGVSGDSVSLITKLGPEADVGKYLEDRYWSGSFEKHLKVLEHPDEELKNSGPISKKISAAVSQASKKYDGVRDLNKLTDATQDKVQLSLQDEPQQSNSVRTLIKEKITKLKPLI